MNPLVSILIPAYNAEKWIADTIRSALSQTWPHKEIIVVDDGSKDRTLAVAQTFASAGVKVVTQPNLGASAARNKALSLYRGDYVQWLDADDLMASDKIALQMEAAKQCAAKRTLFSCAWGYFMYRPSKAKFFPSPLWCDLPPVEWLIHKFEHNAFMADCSWLVSRELTEAAGPWNNMLKKDNDGEYFCRVILVSQAIKYVPGAKVLYRRSGPNSVNIIGNSDQKKDSMFLSLQLHMRYLRSLEDSERTRRACWIMLQNWLPTFHPERPDIVEQMQTIAAQLGGPLEMPKLSWKYAWIQWLFGSDLAKRAQFTYNRLKTSGQIALDKRLFYLEKSLSKEGDRFRTSV